MRGRSAIVLAFLLFGVLMLAGCTKPSIEGEWSDASSTRTIEFDKEWLNAGGQPARYTITGDTSLQVTINGKPVDYRYEIDGDTLDLSGGGYSLDGTWVRVGTDAYDAAKKTAEDAAKQEKDTAAAAAADRLAENACKSVRDEYGRAFEGWFESQYPDISGYSIFAYMQMKNIKLDWDMSTLEQKVDYAEHVVSYEPMSNDVYAYEEANRQKFIDWVKAGKCPSDGTYTVAWDGQGFSPLNVVCSVHGKQ